jgi:hypothetical protein
VSGFASTLLSQNGFAMLELIGCSGGFSGFSPDADQKSRVLVGIRLNGGARRAPRQKAGAAFLLICCGMAKKSNPAALPKILTVRRQRVVLDADLAKLYGVGTKAFNQAIRRNQERFPVDFAFQLTQGELAALRSHFSTSKLESEDSLRSQSVTLKKGGRGRHSKYLPWVFTEHGALMAANILRSGKAVQMSIYLVRAFVRMRDEILANVAILKRLAEIDRRLLEHDVVLREVVERLQPLISALAQDKEPKRKIGFHQGNR